MERGCTIPAFVAIAAQQIVGADHREVICRNQRLSAAAQLGR
jgi:hypothetical protein